MKIYAIPGLGFDQRIFHNLGLEEFDLQYLEWMEPLGDEDFRAYAKRISEQIEAGRSEIVLIGHSLGGMLAQEMAAYKNIKSIFLISSIRSRAELPMHFKIMRPLGLERFFTKELTEKTIKYWGRSHDYDGKKEQDLVVDMVNKMSNRYLQWALRELSVWQGPLGCRETTVHQIHGTKDKTFPIKLIQHPDQIIQGGAHFMIYKKARKIGEWIKKELKA